MDNMYLEHGSTRLDCQHHRCNTRHSQSSEWLTPFQCDAVVNGLKKPLTPDGATKDARVVFTVSAKGSFADLAIKWHVFHMTGTEYQSNDGRTL
jgi:hypothetical protein